MTELNCRSARRGLWGEIRGSVAAEWEAMMSGHFVPYHKLAILVAVITSFMFSIAISHDVVFEAPVAVIDLDQSRWSAQVLEKLNTSPLISVRRVVHTPVDVRGLTRGDSALGVVYIPKGAQAEILRGGRTVTLGYYADDSNTAQNGELYSTLNEIVAELGAEAAVSRPDGVSSLGRNASETEAMISPLRIGFRYLSNPTGQAATGTVVNFIFFFSLMFHGLASLMLIGRMRVTNEWESRVLSGSLLALLARAAPYAFIFTCVVTTALAVMICAGQLRFAGSILLFIPGFFLGAVGNTWLAYLISWNCTNPGQGAGRMIWLVPPGFIMGGATMAVGFLHGWMHLASFGIPLVWIFNFWRDVGLRGVGAGGVASLYGMAILWLLFIGTLVAVRFWREECAHRETVRQNWRDMREIGEIVREREGRGPLRTEEMEMPEPCACDAAAGSGTPGRGAGSSKISSPRTPMRGGSPQAAADRRSPSGHAGSPRAD